MRLNEGLRRSFQAPAAVRKFSSSQVYLFRSGPSDSEESEEEELDVMELRARGKEAQRGKDAAREKVGDVTLLERKVSKEDTLNKLALQYGCKVADIKRINNFIREQDLYALKSVKIPVKANGVLTETYRELLPPEAARLLPADPPEGSRDGSDDGLGVKEPIDQYFRGIDQKIEQAAQGSAAPPSLDYCIDAPNLPPPEENEAGDGADCGIPWWNAVFVMLLVGIVLPVFYIVYFKGQESHVAANASAISANGSWRGAATQGPLRLDRGGGDGPVTPAVPRTGTFIPPGG